MRGRAPEEVFGTPIATAEVAIGERGTVFVTRSEGVKDHPQIDAPSGTMIFELDVGGDLAEGVPFVFYCGAPGGALVSEDFGVRLIDRRFIRVRMAPGADGAPRPFKPFLLRMFVVVPEEHEELAEGTAPSDPDAAAKRAAERHVEERISADRRLFVEVDSDRFAVVLATSDVVGGALQLETLASVGPRGFAQHAPIAIGLRHRLVELVEVWRDHFGRCGAAAQRDRALYVCGRERGHEGEHAEYSDPGSVWFRDRASGESRFAAKQGFESRAERAEARRAFEAEAIARAAVMAGCSEDELRAAIGGAPPGPADPDRPRTVAELRAALGELPGDMPVRLEVFDEVGPGGWSGPLAAFRLEQDGSVVIGATSDFSERPPKADAS